MSGSDYSSDGYDSYSSRSPTPRRPKHHHHHSHHHKRNKKSENNNNSSIMFVTTRRRPSPTSGFAHLFVLALATAIQLFTKKTDMISFSRPKYHEQPLAYVVNKIIDRSPTIPFLNKFTEYPIELFIISNVVFSIYDILASSSGSSVSSLLISLMFLFDETTLFLIMENPSIAFQLNMIAFCVKYCQQLLVYELFSYRWLISAIISILVAVVSSFIRVEALPIFIPVVVSILFSSRYKGSRTSFFYKIWKTIVASVSLIVLCCVCLAVVFFALSIFGLPKYIFVDNNPNLIVTEFLTNRHNFGVLLMLPVVLLFFWITDVEGFWIVSFIGCLVFTVMLPVSCVLNSLETNVAFSLFYYLIICGFVLTDRTVSSVSVPILLVTLGVVVYFYFHPL